jgi:hypothetical protein
MDLAPLVLAPSTFERGTNECLHPDSLIVGEDEMLSHTRAFLLAGSEWNIGTMNPAVTTDLLKPVNTIC